MPEIAEVARIVHYIRQHLVGKTIASATAVEDANVFGKVGTSSAQVQKALHGNTIVAAGQQGKYFWMVMDKPPHLLMHFGMTGWLKIRSEDTYYYRKEGGGGDGDGDDEWPPRFWKFHLATKGEPKVEAAFVDSRRFARVRLLDCAADDIRKITPLKENGPDPVVDKALVTGEWLMELCRRKKIPIKALLLDQANISGVGNWVGDEIMFHARIHPEQYSNTLSDDQLKQLHASIHYICSTAVDLLADSEKYPEDWLFKHRWGKGKKDAAQKLPSGEKITFLTVGGRTSAVVPSLQKKTGPVAKEMSEAESGGESDGKGPKTSSAKAGRKKKRADDKPVADAVHGHGSKVNSAGKEEAPAKRERKSRFKEEMGDEEMTKAKKRKSAPQEEVSKSDVNADKPAQAHDSLSKKKKTDKVATGDSSKEKRRSTRLSRR